ncbi:MAG: N-acetylmuramoyl-L-alanine amidase, partial [Planctomycetota bacterium]
GANRSSVARFTVHHTGGSTLYQIDQTLDDRTWVRLGDHAFSQAQGAVIVLDNQSPTGGVVIADAVRLGAGNGSINSGGGTSGQRRWRECSRYWAQYAGAPSTVWNSIAGGQDNDDDVTCRPRFAEWRTADAFVSLHTNAGGGAGTSTYIHNTAPSAGSSTLQSRIHTQLIADLRAEWAPTWTDRGQLSANFGEVRLLSTMPGVLIELAFHDTPGSLDLNSIHDPRFRYLAGRAIARGVMRYFQPVAPFVPEPPAALRVVQDGARGLQVAWNAVVGATDYVVEWSPDGKGFVEAASVAATTWSTGPLPFDALWSFRVRSRNSSGCSVPTEVLCAGTDHLGTARVLLVQGFDRLSRTVPVRDNSRDYLARFGQAIRDNAAFSVAFDAATNDAVKAGAVLLANYEAVIWASGEESTADETFDAQEQFLVTGYLNAGGRLFASGAEIGWDLDAQGSVVDRTFFNTELGADYVADDANVYFLQAGVAGGIFDGLPAGRFDDGTFGTYDVDWPDVLAPFGPGSSVCMRYSNGQVAGVQRVNGSERTLLLGFPFEAITDRQLRASVMRRALRFLLDLPLDCAETIALNNRLNLAIDSPADAGETYVVLCSYARQPGIPLPGGGLLPLQYSFLIDASIDPSFPLFGNFVGTLDGAGQAAPFVDVPPLAFLIGFPLYFSGLTAPPGPFVEDTVFNWVGTVIVP